MIITEQASLQSLLADLIATWENEVVEFKQAGNDYPTDKIGSYFSALANEANLRGVERAWLVFGVDNKTRTVAGSDYRPEPERLQSTKMQIAQSSEPSITFRREFVIFSCVFCRMMHCLRWKFPSMTKRLCWKPCTIALPIRIIAVTGVFL